MKILLDECVHQDLRRRIVGHDVFTVGYLRWKGTKNGRLLARANTEGFDAMVTTDRDLEFQQNHATLPISVFILDAVSTELPDLIPLVPSLLFALSSPPSRPTFVHVRP